MVEAAQEVGHRVEVLHLTLVPALMDQGVQEAVGGKYQSQPIIPTIKDFCKKRSSTLNSTLHTSIHVECDFVINLFPETPETSN